MAKFSGFLKDYYGLSTKQVQENQIKYGANILAPKKKENIILKVLFIFKEPMFLLLFGTSIIYFIFNESQDGATMLVFVVFVAGINLWQEFKTEKALQALRKLSVFKVSVIRNERIYKITSSELTVSDVVMIQEGDKIQADGKILELNGLSVNESILTGESMVVWKSLKNEDETAFWEINKCYAGTIVTNGSGIYEVTAIGKNSEYGKIGSSLASIKTEHTLLEKNIRKLVNIATMISIILFVFTFTISYVKGQNIIESLLSAITLAMAMIPEEFPVILTIFLAMGAMRLAKKNSLIRKLNSIETLGSISVLCVDKTGTLTKNEMNIEEIFCYKNFSKKDLINYSVLASETHPIDPMEHAIHDFAKKNDQSLNKIYQNNLLHEYSFSSETKMMGHIWQVGKDKVLAVKGAFESVIPLCTLSSEDILQMQFTQKELAKKGYRVLVIAKSNIDKEIPIELKDNKLDLIGFIALTDPPREGVQKSIQEAIKAGIRVIMITGDNGNTARAIAKRLGFTNIEDIITGHQLDTLSKEELNTKIKTINIFARVIPNQKLKIVNALKSIGEVVAMTGDGVNDAPALKSADIGIAMGKRGTEVAKEAADLIILDDNFNTIINTIKDGRRIYSNIKKAISYVLIVHIPIALLSLFSPILNLPVLLLPIHIVILELIIDPTCSIIFERTPIEKDTMLQNPRDPKEPLITFKLLISSIIQGLSIFITSIVTYYLLLNNSWTNEEARAVVMFILVFSNLLLVYTKKSISEITLVALIKTKDSVVILINFVILVGILLLNFTSWGNNLAKIQPLNLSEIGVCFLLAFISVCWIDLWKILKIVKNKMVIN